MIAGESAGGYYAALTLLRIRDELDAADRVVGANLVFGVYDLSGTPSIRGARPSDTPDILTEDVGAFVNECFLPGRSVEDCKAPSISPLYADLHDLPPALFTVGQRRPPPRRQPLHGRALGGLRQRVGAGGVSRLHPRLHRRSPSSWRSGPTSASTTFLERVLG